MNLGPSLGFKQTGPMSLYCGSRPKILAGWLVHPKFILWDQPMSPSQELMTTSVTSVPAYLTLSTSQYSLGTIVANSADPDETA